MKPLTVLLIVLIQIAIPAAAQDATALYTEGIKLKGAGKSLEAMKKFEQASQLKLGYTEAMYEMGWCQNDNKLYTKAISTFRIVRQSWNHIAKLHFELGYAFEKNNDTDSAITAYNRCLQIAPSYALAYKQLGFISYARSEYERALLQFEKAITNAKTPITDYLFWYRKGFSENAIKDYNAAKISLQNSLNSKTDYLNTYLELGFASTKLKQDEEAIDYFKKGMATDPKSHVPLNGIAEVYRDNKKDMAQAMIWYQKTLALNPNERKANYGMGYCSNSLGKYSDAINYLKKAIEYESTYTAAYVELGYAYHKSNNNTEALTNFKKAISQNPKNENARYYSGLVYINQNDKANAQKMVDELKGLNSKNATALQEKVNKM
jgi:tetratricopeptide (TPR) repeat protein